MKKDMTKKRDIKGEEEIKQREVQMISAMGRGREEERKYMGEKRVRKRKGKKRVSN